MALYIGLMSGTSMDGIDAAIIELPGNTLVAGITQQYSDDVKQRLHDLAQNTNVTLAAICQLNTLIGQEFATAANTLIQKAQLSHTQITAIGSHGQTVCHDTSCDIPYTLQLGCGHTIASLTNITVVADFRTRDMVNGGQGAPFAPLYHQEIVPKIDSPIAIVNIGGIANISFMSPDEKTQGWDIGPGNCLMDAWIYRHKGHIYDESGAWARQGTVIQSLLDQLMADPFICLKAPKSIGKEYFSLEWLERYVSAVYVPVDVQSTLAALTAQTISDSILKHQKHISHLYLCGGGAHNDFVHHLLTHLLPDVKVHSIAALNLSPDYLEAMMFAWLAAQTIAHKAVDLTEITGSKRPEILGAIYPVLKSY